MIAVVGQGIDDHLPQHLHHQLIIHARRPGGGQLRITDDTALGDQGDRQLQQGVIERIRRLGETGSPDGVVIETGPASQQGVGRQAVLAGVGLTDGQCQQLPLAGAEPPLAQRVGKAEQTVEQGR